MHLNFISKKKRESNNCKIKISYIVTMNDVVCYSKDVFFNNEKSTNFIEIFSKRFSWSENSNSNVFILRLWLHCQWWLQSNEMKHMNYLKYKTKFLKKNWKRNTYIEFTFIGICHFTVVIFCCDIVKFKRIQILGCVD